MSKNITFMPNDFQLEGSRIIGNYTEYEFDGIIGEGSQGIVTKYSNKENSVVFKWFPQQQENASTQVNSKDGEDTTYNSFLNEMHYIQLLTFYSKIVALHEREGFENFEPLDFLSKAEYDVGIDQITNKFSPLYFDDARKILDKNNIAYHPLSKPKNKIASTYIKILNQTQFVPLQTYEQGINLETILKNNLDIKNKEKITLNILEKVIALHHFGFIHRDLKPENILINNEEVSLIDYGLAQDFGPSDRLAYLANMLEEPTKYIPDLKFFSENFSGPRLFYLSKGDLKPLNKDDMFALGIISSIVLTGEHPYLSEYVSSYNEFLNLDPNTQKNIKREFSKTTEDMTQMINTYNQFIEKHEDNKLLMELKDLFHPIENNRPNRLRIVADNLNIKTPNSPPIFDREEIYRNVYQIRDYEMKFVEKLINNKELNFTYFNEYIDTALVRTNALAQIVEETKSYQPQKNKTLLEKIIGGFGRK